MILKGRYHGRMSLDHLYKYQKPTILQPHPANNSEKLILGTTLGRQLAEIYFILESYRKGSPRQKKKKTLLPPQVIKSHNILS